MYQFSKYALVALVCVVATVGVCDYQDNTDASLKPDVRRAHLASLSSALKDRNHWQEMWEINLAEVHRLEHQNAKLLRQIDKETQGGVDQFTQRANAAWELTKAKDKISDLTWQLKNAERSLLSAETRVLAKHKDVIQVGEAVIAFGAERLVRLAWSASSLDQKLRLSVEPELHAPTVAAIRRVVDGTFKKKARPAVWRGETTGYVGKSAPRPLPPLGPAPR